MIFGPANSHKKSGEVGAPPDQVSFRANGENLALKRGQFIGEMKGWQEENKTFLWPERRNHGLRGF
jgi:hypothetical protein